MFLVYYLATETNPELGGIDDHTLEWYLLVATGILAAITLATALVTGLLAWVSWKLYKIDAEKTEKIVSESGTVANNSINSMEHVAVNALSHPERVRRMNRIRRGRGI
jgi:hypothetical protein